MRILVVILSAALTISVNFGYGQAGKYSLKDVGAGYSLFNGDSLVILGKTILLDRNQSAELNGLIDQFYQKREEVQLISQESKRLFSEIRNNYKDAFDVSEKSYPDEQPEKVQVKDYQGVKRSIQGDIDYLNNQQQYLSNLNSIYERHLSGKKVRKLDFALLGFCSGLAIGALIFILPSFF